MAGVLGPKGDNGEGLDEESIRMQKTFVPLVLAEDVTVRKSSPNADWADTYVSAALSGVTELHGKWCSGAGCNSGPPGVMFQGGEEFWVYLDCNNNEGRQDCILSAHPAVAARRRCRESFRQICKPLGEFVHPPLRLSHDSRELISGVYIDPLTSKALRAGAGDLSYSYRAVIIAPDDADEYVVLWLESAKVDTLNAPDKNQQFINWVVPRALAAVRDFGDNARFAAVKANLKAAAEALRDADVADNDDVETKAKALGNAALPARTTAEDELTQTGPGFRKPRGGDLVLVDDAKVNINITESAREFYGRDFYGGTQSAKQSNALSGHGTALVA